MFSFEQHIEEFLLLLITLLCVYIFTRSKWLYKTSTNKYRLPPSPPHLPILGNLHQLSALTHRSLHSLSSKYGPITHLHFGSKPVIVIQSSQAAREILKTNDHIFSSKPELRIMRRLLYDLRTVSASPYGEYWRKLKSICILQLLSSKRVQSFRSIREEETSLLVSKIVSCCSSSSPVNLSELFILLTNDVICRAAFGMKYSEGKDGKKFLILLNEIMHLLGSINIGEFVPCLSWISHVNGYNNRVHKAARQVDELLEIVVQEHLINVEETAKDANRENFVDILLDIRKDLAMDRNSIKALILDMLVGGTDTGFATLEWAMTELLRNPMVMKKLQDEVRGIMNGRHDIVDGDLEKMQYLKAVVKETLRFHTPVPFLAREPREDVKIMGYDVAAGTIVLINTWGIGRDPASWDEPETFKPERFLSCSIDFKGLDFELLPFGSGRRHCPGIAFGIANVEMVLANLMQKFDWELPNGKNVGDLDCIEDPGVTIHRKNPLFVVAKQRERKVYI